MSLKYDGKRVKQKKTTIRKSCANPYFNESFNFDIPFKQIKSVTLDVSVSSPGRIGSRRIGRVELGCGVPSAPQALHWNDMLANARHPIARWHPLQRDEK
jgi:hypothetical protein